MINDKESVKAQYTGAENLNTRISIHSKYSVNKQGFGNWIMSNYEIKDGDRILELGCGTGIMWKDHQDMADRASELILTDLSEGMLLETRRTLGERGHISYRTVDIQDIPFEDKSFDVVIANMMLYHVPDLDRALSEVSRVLKRDGTFYCATSGEKGIVEYVAGLISDYRARGNIGRKREYKSSLSFTLQNGEKILLKHFSSAQRLDYPDGLKVTQIQDLIDYLYSLTDMTAIGEMDREELGSILEQNKVDGILYVPKEYGMFVCEGIK